MSEKAKTFKGPCVAAFDSNFELLCSGIRDKKISIHLTCLAEVGTEKWIIGAHYQFEGAPCTFYAWCGTRDVMAQERQNVVATETRDIVRAIVHNSDRQFWIVGTESVILSTTHVYVQRLSVNPDSAANQIEFGDKVLHVPLNVGLEYNEMDVHCVQYPDATLSVLLNAIKYETTPDGCINSADVAGSTSHTNRPRQSTDCDPGGSEQ